MEGAPISDMLIHKSDYIRNRWEYTRVRQQPLFLQSHYWEHLGMLNIPEYKQDWGRKEEWYRKNGYHESLITSKDGPDGSINSIDIEELIKARISV